ncbi:kinase-like protein [Coprinopsis marcescibilis]|uniref:Kinase-like protein n=1 Tax=Coprinopsis marcescibilis TaxID=230819 RepID=A0A5C3KKP5_COPMA|nr:kinase-like protein [Coprinopsis marcescibilis]
MACRSSIDSRTQHPAPEFYPLEPIIFTNQLETTSTRKRRINQYLRGDKIGKGRHGEVYLCQDSQSNNREVALKVVKRSHPRDKMKLLRKNYQQGESSSSHKLPPNSTENSIRKEIAVLKACGRHPNLVTLLEVIDDSREEKIYLVLEYLSGGPVEWATPDHTPLLTLEQTRRILRDVILGVEFMHSKNILHRDIKPANIMYTEDRRSVKLIDFGVSHIIYPGSSKKSTKGAENSDREIFPPSDLLKRIGTPSFLAPEVVWFAESPELSFSASQESMPSTSSDTTVVNTFPMPKTRPPITKAVDIWALAITFYCLLFGHTPFTGSTDENDNVHHNELMLYHRICTQDWTLGDSMGVERIPTEGRHPKDRCSDGFLVVQLLEGMLQKNPQARISLLDVKKHTFVLRDIPNPKEWLRRTAQTPPERYSTCWAKRMFGKLLHKNK